MKTLHFTTSTYTKRYIAGFCSKINLEKKYKYNKKTFKKKAVYVSYSFINKEMQEFRG